MAEISEKLFQKLKELGIIDDSEVRSSNYGKSDYSKHLIQPWSIWKEYNLNPWDADLVKRVLRTKEEPGMSKEESRIMDYEKIIHICRERIRQLEEDKQTQKSICIGWSINTISIPKPTITYSLNEKEVEAYTKFQNKHYELHNEIKSCGCSVIFTHTGIGLGKTVQCNVCGEKQDITDYDNW